VTLTARQLVPLAITVVVVGGITWLLLDRDVALGRWLLAFLILGHGLAHLAFVVSGPQPASGEMDWPFDTARSWLIPRFGLNPGVVGSAARALTGVAIAAALLAALATVGVVVSAEWWSGLVVLLAVSSALLLTLVVSAMFVIGYGIDLALLWLALVSGWSPAG
jgi:hypothetical protein